MTKAGITHIGTKMTGGLIIALILLHFGFVIEAVIAFIFSFTCFLGFLIEAFRSE